MSSGNALAVIQPSEWQMMVEMASYLVKSGFLPQGIKTPEQALAIILAGRELNIAPWQSLSTINVIQGKPTISPQLMLALIQRSGLLENIEIDSDAVRCVVIMKRRGQSAHKEIFSIADANAMQLAGKDNYKKQPATMLKWRAVAACARVVFPDVILGLYTPDELGADVTVSEDGQMTVTAPPAPQLPETVTEAEVVEDAPKANGKAAATPPGRNGQTGPTGRDEPASASEKLAAVFKRVEHHYPEDTEQGRKAHFRNHLDVLEKAGRVAITMSVEEIVAAIDADRAEQGKADKSWWLNAATMGEVNAILIARHSMDVQQAVKVMGTSLDRYASKKAFLEACKLQFLDMTAETA